MKTVYVFIALVFLLTSCAPTKRQVITINTVPQGADIIVAEKDYATGEVTKKRMNEKSPVQFELTQQKPKATFNDNPDLVSSRPNLVKDPKYTVIASKDGYFTEQKQIVDFSALNETGHFDVKMDVSPLWFATEESNAANQWMNLVVSSEISDVDMWQRVVDAVTKRFPELKEYDFTSGYLATALKVKKYETDARGTYLLRSRFIATVMERDPLTYRLKIESQWSNIEGIDWHPYPRVFKEDAAMVEELMSRFQAY